MGIHQIYKTQASIVNGKAAFLLSGEVGAIL
jgi:hypothetical protein